MANRTCSLPGCGKPNRARGLCSTHYNQTHQPDRHKPTTITCETCGAQHRTVRTDGRFCSLLCRDVWRNNGEPTSTRLPLNHPVVRLANGLPAIQEKKIRPETKGGDL